MPIPFIPTAYAPFFTTFLFIFAIVYGVLGSAGLFKDKNVNAVIALAFALFASAYQPLVTGLQQFLPIAAGLIVVLFFVLLIKKVAGDGAGKDAMPTIIALGLGLLLVGLLWNDISRFLPTGFSPDNALWVIAFVVIVAIFWAIHKHSG
jgi:hypothetical protein